MVAPLARPPIPPTALIAPEDEIARIRELLAESRPVTLTGAGGTGNTCLALAVIRLFQAGENPIDPPWRLPAPN